MREARKGSVKRRSWRAAAIVVGSLALAGCAPFATTPSSPSPSAGAGPSTAPPTGTATSDAAAAGEVVRPNPNLFVQGIPPIPASLAADVERWTDFRGHGFVDWHPTRREMIVAGRPDGGNTTQLLRVASPLARPEPITDFADPVRSALYEPLRGDAIVFARSVGGSEAAQLYRLDLATKAVAAIGVPDTRNDLEAFLHRESKLLHFSVPLDRTAAGGTRSKVVRTLWLVDPANPDARRKLAELDEGAWSADQVSWDDRQLAMTRYVSAAESEVWLLDLASGEKKRVLPEPGSAETGTFFAGPWKKDGSGFFAISDRGSEFRELWFCSLRESRLVPITHHVKWDVEGASLDAEGRVLAVRFNVEGRSELRFFDGQFFQELPTPALPAGSVRQAAFHPKLPLLAFAVNDSSGPSRVGTVSSTDGKVAAWTEPPMPPGLDAKRFAAQRIVRWKSFDGREISGLLTLPPPRFAGPRPVVVLIHGGPEEQARFGFLGRWHYVVEELGIAVLQPNVRGSAGFGKTFLALDNGKKREDSVKDIGALFDWIAAEPRLDAKRVVVSGGSYGGYMSLATATHYADRIAGAIDVVGISNFVTFLTNTESYRRDLRRVEYGDERDPQMREFLTRISPLTNASRITKPLFVVQGRNDPRVPWTEAEQIVAAARASGARVWYLRGENEGHGFARKDNADFEFQATVLFLRELLLK